MSLVCDAATSVPCERREAETCKESVAQFYTVSFTALNRGGSLSRSLSIGDRSTYEGGKYPPFLPVSTP